MAATSHHDHHDDHEHGHHIIPQKLLFTVGGALVVLMALTIAAAKVPDGMGIHVPYWIAWVIAITIAYCKAFLVVQYFMGVKYTTKLIKVFAYGGFVWVLFLTVMLTDYMTRPVEPVQGWEASSETALPRGDRPGR